MSESPWTFGPPCPPTPGESDLESDPYLLGTSPSSPCFVIFSSQGRIRKSYRQARVLSDPIAVSLRISDGQNQDRALPLPHPQLRIRLEDVSLFHLGIRLGSRGVLGGEGSKGVIILAVTQLFSMPFMESSHRDTGSGLRLRQR